MSELSPYELKVAEILEGKLQKVGIDMQADLTPEQISVVEELTKEAQDEAKEVL